jgi:hypothetical protein
MRFLTELRSAIEPSSEAESHVSRDYIELLDRIHRHLLPRTYAEIGVQSGRSLALSLPGTVAVGVDPEPRLTARIPRSTKVVPLTSDEFFRQHISEDFFGETPLDLAFIDGMHLFEFALRDFINLEKWCTGDSVILAHDCYPIDERSAARVRTTSKWTGDVWKLVPCLREFRPDLKISTIDVPPSGLCVITGLDASSRILEDEYKSICERFIGLDYAVISTQKDQVVNAVPNDWTAVKRLLPNVQFRLGNPKRLALVRSLQGMPNSVLRKMVKPSIVVGLGQSRCEGASGG